MKIEELSDEELVNAFQSEITGKLMNAGNFEVSDLIQEQIDKLRDELLSRLKLR